MVLEHRYAAPGCGWKANNRVYDEETPIAIKNHLIVLSKRLPINLTVLFRSTWRKCRIAAALNTVKLAVSYRQNGR